ncbi:hypothetical protein [Vagococcus fessus]|uniref:Uncharacterized protein n=1 Tax=Vagococcus fessus TaxID=120370 RepID=A0A430AB75_9ENTE|nr:hypothetical protein [Vagococcus fessus]RSU04485.1 hypothetical protein CBF31_00245 [Vagococcus fessus]
MRYFKIIVNRVLFFVFFMSTFTIAKSLMTDSGLFSNKAAIIMLVTSLVGIINTINPFVIGKVTNTRLRPSNAILLLIAIITLATTGELTKMASSVERKITGQTPKLEKEIAEEVKKETETKTEKTKVVTDTSKEVGHKKPIDEKKQKKELYQLLSKKIDNLEKDDVNGHLRYSSSYLEDNHRSNQVYPYLVTSRRDDMEDLTMNLWIRYSYAGEDALDLQKFTIQTDTMEYTMDAYDVRVDRDLGLPKEIDETEETKPEADGSTWEWVEFSPNSDKLEMLRDMASSKHVSLHYKGREGSESRELKEVELVALRQVLQVYDIFLVANTPEDTK